MLYKRTTCISCISVCESLCQAIHLKTHLPLVPHICRWTGPSLVQVMSCRIFGAKPLPETMLAYCQLDSWEQISVKFESEFYNFHSSKCISKCRLSKWRPFCPGGFQLKIQSMVHVMIAMPGESLTGIIGNLILSHFLSTLQYTYIYIYIYIFDIQCCWVPDDHLNDMYRSIVVNCLKCIEKGGNLRNSKRFCAIIN